jgi:hypothetical protein
MVMEAPFACCRIWTEAFDDGFAITALRIEITVLRRFFKAECPSHKNRTLVAYVEASSNHRDARTQVPGRVHFDRNSSHLSARARNWQLNRIFQG